MEKNLREKKKYWNIIPKKSFDKDMEKVDEETRNKAIYNFASRS
jgi:hypothetical protein